MSHHNFVVRLAIGGPVHRTGQAALVRDLPHKCLEHGRHGTGRPHPESTYGHMVPPPPSRRVLLVEDDDQSRAALQNILEQEGFDVLAARDGGEGIEMVAGFRPDAIVLDLALPGINGFDAAHLLKSDTDTSEIPLIAVTASWLGTEGERLRRIGFESALRKPFPPAALIEALRRAMRH